MPGIIVQGAHFGGSRSRLSLALSEGVAGTRTDRHFQPQLLRGDAGGAGASGVFGRAKAAGTLSDETYLGRAISGHRRLRTLPDPQRDDRTKVLPARLKRGATEALSRADRSAGEELEVLRQRREGARVLGRLHDGLRADDPRDCDGRFAVVCGAGG